jgi:hypothetical protein
MIARSLGMLLLAAALVPACTPARAGGTHASDLPDGRVLEFDAAMLIGSDAGPPHDAGRDASRDAGHTSNDAGHTSIDAWRAPDAGPQPEHASVTIGGARSAHYDFTEPTNYVDCITDGAGLLSIEAYQVPGTINDGFEFITTDWFTGPGTFAYTYVEFGSNNPSINTHTSGSYKYWFFYDYSRVDFHNVYSTCTLSFSSTVHPRIDGTLTCTNLVAMNISADYQSSPAVFEPHVSLNATFSCDLRGPW